MDIRRTRPSPRLLRHLGQLLPRYLTEEIELVVDMRLVASSGLFDRSWYLMQNPDVTAASVDSLKHCLRHGGMEGREPGPRFSSELYLQSNPHVAHAGLNPLVHYLRNGARAEMRPMISCTP